MEHGGCATGLGLVLVGARSYYMLMLVLSESVWCDPETTK